MYVCACMYIYMLKTEVKICIVKSDSHERVLTQCEMFSDNFVVMSKHAQWKQGEDWDIEGISSGLLFSAVGSSSLDQSKRREF